MNCPVSKQDHTSMPRYSLRTLLILLAILPPLIWFGWTKYEAWRAVQERQRLMNIIVEAMAAGDNAATLQALRALSQAAAPPPPADNSNQDNIWTPPNTPLPPGDPFATP